MPRNRIAVILMTVVAFVGPTAADEKRESSHEETAASSQIDLPSHLKKLLQEEMRAVAGGIRAIAPAIGIGSYEEIEAEAKKIEASYILNKRLSEEDARHLEHALPEGFKTLDLQFHQRAGALARAAKDRDSDLVLHHYNKLLESCVACHSQYATVRFPELATEPSDHHHGH